MPVLVTEDVIILFWSYNAQYLVDLKVSDRFTTKGSTRQV